MQKATFSQIEYLVSLGMPRAKAEKLSKQRASSAIDDLKTKKSESATGTNPNRARSEQSGRKLRQIRPGSSESECQGAGKQTDVQRQATLKQTSSEYRLYTDYSQRDLARQIKGGRWDPLHRSWVFPKTAVTLDAIRSVFEGRLVDTTVGRVADVGLVSKFRKTAKRVQKSRRDRPLLRETPKHYCLYVQRSQKRRAMAIPEYRLDPRRGCWVYPKLRYIYDAILKEFGKNLCNEASRPQKKSFPPPKRVEETRTETAKVRTEADKLCEQCGERLHPTRLEVKPGATTCAKCDGGSDGGSFKQLDASEQWFRRDQSWISKANRKGRR